jgi:Arm DNA-binding domain
MLTDAAVKNKKLSKKLQKFSDSGGLQLWFMPSGSKLWRVAFRFSGKQKLLSIGRYPQVGLLDARKLRDVAKEQLQAGKDPTYEKKLVKLSKATTRKNTFIAISTEWLEQQRAEGKATITIHKKEWLLGMAWTILSERPISEISSQEVLLVLKRVEKQGKYETAKRLRSVLGSVFRYAIATARASNDPTSALRGALIAPRV